MRHLLARMVGMAVRRLVTWQSTWSVPRRKVKRSLERPGAHAAQTEQRKVPVGDTKERPLMSIAGGRF